MIPGAAIDYRGKMVVQLSADIRGAAPAAIDMVFKNVGGARLNATRLHLNHGPRVALIGLISQYR